MHIIGNNPTLTINIEPLADGHFRINLRPSNVPTWPLAHEALLMALALTAQQVAKGQGLPASYGATVHVLRTLLKEIEAAAPTVEVIPQLPSNGHMPT